jgi:Na+-transporting NADH:ubiquinone oxidoreductase subunit NqrD
MTLPKFINTLTIRAGLGVLVLGTTSFLAVTDRIDGASYLGLALLVAGFFYKGEDRSTRE